MKYIFESKLTEKEKRYVWNRFRVLYPDAKSKEVNVVRLKQGFICHDKINDIVYKIKQRRIGVLNDSEIRFKCTSDEKNKLDQYCYKNNVSLSEICRLSINNNLNIKFFES